MAETSTAIALPKGRIQEIGGVWYVQQQNLDGTWATLNSGYQHQTSAYAGLGRLYHKASTEGAE